ncbi:hypothetical protein [Bacillus sp. FJAT-45037]|nr:hypothetical protein [Bacillus sp. FJAT-45037]
MKWKTPTAFMDIMKRRVDGIEKPYKGYYLLNAEINEDESEEKFLEK